jgi:exopolysaccharide production protein ExoQ
MSPQLAFWICALCIGWLFIRDGRRREGFSTALWIPLLWALIIGSRPLSSWFGLGAEAGQADDYLEGSPFDRFFFLFLIAAGLLVLKRRQTNWPGTFAKNKWLVVFFLYLGLSAVWSDYPFVSLKRWVKDCGNAVMVLVVLSESDPLEAVKALLARCCYVLVPLSVLMIKYFPDLSRYYDKWTGQPSYCGVTTDKNMLGMTTAVCCLFLIWDLLELPSWRLRRINAVDLANRLVLLAMLWWLFTKQRSSTSLACTILAGGFLVATKHRRFREQVKNLGLLAFAAALLFALSQFAFEVSQAFVQLLGRDLTLTGRTAIWSAVLAEGTNPLIGEGFYSFWLGDRATRLSEKYHYLLNEAHSGYLEVYLNSGALGLLLLSAVLVSSVKKIKTRVVAGDAYARLALVFLGVAVMYGVTEAVFNRLSLIWFVFLLAIIESPRPRTGASAEHFEGTEEPTGWRQSRTYFACLQRAIQMLATSVLSSRHCVLTVDVLPKLQVG